MPVLSTEHSSHEFICMCTGTPFSCHQMPFVQSIMISQSRVDEATSKSSKLFYLLFYCLWEFAGKHFEDVNISSFLGELDLWEYFVLIYSINDIFNLWNDLCAKAPSDLHDFHVLSHLMLPITMMEVKLIFSFYI